MPDPARTRTITWADPTEHAWRASTGPGLEVLRQLRQTHSTPVLTTLHGMRQLIWATQGGLVSVNPQTGALIWKAPYPFGYTTSLRGMSQGRASNTMEFLEYRPMPANLVKAIKEGTEGKK